MRPNQLIDQDRQTVVRTRWSLLACAVLPVAGCAALGQDPSECGAPHAVAACAGCATVAPDQNRSRADGPGPRVFDVRGSSLDTGNVPTTVSADVAYIAVKQQADAESLDEKTGTAHASEMQATGGQHPSATPRPPAAVQADQHVDAEASQSRAGRLEQLADAAVQAYEGIENYSCVVTRQERLAGRLGERETLRLEFRKHPWSVHFTWIAKPHRGRELVYVKGHYEELIHGREPTFFGRIPIKMDPDGELATRSARYPITEAGIGNAIDKFDQTVAQSRAGTLGGRLQYLGQVQRPEASQPLHRVQQTTENGTRRDLYFDPATSLPVLIEAFDADGELLEYYHFQELRTNLPELDSLRAFDPRHVLS